MALETRLEAMDAVARQPLKSIEDDMDTSSSVLRRRDRSMVGQSNIENPTLRAEGNRSRGDVPAATLAAGLAAIHTHAQ